MNNMEKGSSKFLRIILDNDEYALNIEFIKTIIENNVKITRVPQMPSYVEGIINLRGQIAAVIDMKERLEIKNNKYDENARIIIVDFDDMLIGLKVDSVKKVIQIDEDSMENVKKIVRKRTNDLVGKLARIDERIINILNLEKIIITDETV